MYCRSSQHRTSAFDIFSPLLSSLQLHRHGARFPEEHDQKATMEALAKYQTARAFLTSELQFLMNYTYDLGTDSLVELGAEQCVKSSWR